MISAISILCFIVYKTFIWTWPYLQYVYMSYRISVWMLVITVFFSICYIPTGIGHNFHWQPSKAESREPQSAMVRGKPRHDSRAVWGVCLWLILSRHTESSPAFTSGLTFQISFRSFFSARIWGEFGREINSSLAYQMLGCDIFLHSNGLCGLLKSTTFQLSPF